MTKLESGSTGNFPKRVFWIIYNPKATDLSEADFVRAEEERLGVTADTQPRRSASRRRAVSAPPTAAPESEVRLSGSRTPQSGRGPLRGLQGRWWCMKVGYAPVSGPEPGSR